MSHETFELIDRLRKAGRRAAMATLVRTIGTTPRKEGTKMFVGADGNAASPQLQIALSIVAEIVAVMRGRKGASPSAR